jgi:parallel beta-helix repeat protein
VTSGAASNVISNNTVTNNGRFGIEIKMPNGTGAASGDGSIVVENNVSLRHPAATYVTLLALPLCARL